MAIDFSKLDDVHKSIEKELGEGVVRDVETFKTIERVPCSLPSLADVLGGGWPIARIMEIYGPESSGKSAIATLAGADFQRVEKFVAYLDLEYAFDYSYSNRLGLLTDAKHFHLYQPTNAEEAFEIADKLCKAGVDLVIFDSVAAMTPKAEGEAGYAEAQMGSMARAMGKGIRKISSVMRNSRTTLIFCNQLRFKIGTVYGNPETQPGGNSLKYASSIRLDVRKAENIELSTGEIRGIISRITCKKNKTAAVGKKCEVKLNFETGYNIFEDYIENAVSCKIVDKAGSWYSYKGEKLGQGVDKVTAFFKDKPDIFAKVKKQVDSFVQKQCIESANKTGEIDDETGEIIQEEATSEEPIEETSVETKNDIAADVPKKRGRKPKVKVEEDIGSIAPIEENA